MFLDDPAKLVEKLGVPAFLIYVVIKDVLPKLSERWGRRSRGPTAKQYRETAELVKAAWTAAHDRDLQLLNERISQLKGDLGSHVSSNDKHFDDISRGLTNLLKAQHAFVDRAGNALSHLTERLAAVEAHLEHLLRKTD